MKLSQNKDRRREPRRSYSGFIFFATDTEVYEGFLKNFSRTGLFIESSTNVTVGERITIALPHFDDKRSGCIMWRTHSGFGVRLGSHSGSARQPSQLYNRISKRVIRLFGNNA